MDPQVQDITLEALKVLLLLATPVIVALTVIGTLIAAMQTAASLHEPALGYGFKLLALAAVLYFIFPMAAQSLVALCTMVYQ